MISIRSRNNRHLDRWYWFVMLHSSYEVDGEWLTWTRPTFPRHLNRSDVCAAYTKRKCISLCVPRTLTPTSGWEHIETENSAHYQTILPERKTRHNGMIPVIQDGQHNTRKPVGWQQDSTSIILMVTIRRKNQHEQDRCPHITWTTWVLCSLRQKMSVCGHS